MPHIAIIGLGFTGASLGLALRAARVEYEIVGHDRDLETAGRARKRGAIDKAEWNLPATVAGAGLVILAVPLDALATLFAQIAPHLSEGCVVTDTASVKGPVLAWASATLPPTVSFVGGHPMAAKHGNSVEDASADLFRGQPYCLTPPATVAAGAIDLAVELASLVGGQPYFLEASEHDSFAAAVDHLPIVAAVALMRTVAEDRAWTDAARLAGSRFGDAVRLASGDPATYRAICQANRNALLRRLDGYCEQLAVLRQLIAAETSGSAELERYFRLARERHEKWREGPAAPPEAPAPPHAGELVRQLLIGRLGERRQ